MMKLVHDYHVEIFRIDFVDPVSKRLHRGKDVTTRARTLAADQPLTEPWLPQYELKDLLALPAQATVNMSLAPDGLALLFDQTMPGDPSSSDGGADAASHLWILPLFATPAERLAATPVQIPPEKLPFKGMHPIWLP